MKIYLSHNRAGDFRNDLYAPLTNGLPGHEWVFPHENNDLPFDSKKLFRNKECDVVLAEVSEPSTGQGIELGWADCIDIPIICCSKTGSRISQSLYAVTDRFLEYDTVDDLISKLRAQLS